MKIKCDNCNKEFSRISSEVKRSQKLGRKQFCSLRCSSQSRSQFLASRRKPNHICAWCGNNFYRCSTSFSKSGLRFCNRKCKEAAQSIGGIKEIQPNHYHNGHSGYRKKALAILPNICARCGWNKVPNVLHVHHKDKNRTNCAIENLEILCPNCHAIEHRYSPN